MEKKYRASHQSWTPGIVILALRPPPPTYNYVRSKPYRNLRDFIIPCSGVSSLYIPKKKGLDDLVCLISHFWSNLTGLL